MKKLIILFILFPCLAFAQVKPGSGGAKDNVTIIYDEISGEPRMVVIDAADLSDPAWNPPGTVQLPIDPKAYNAQDPESFEALMFSLAPMQAVPDED